MSDGNDWCLIESDPGVFTELLTKIGCRGIQVDELWSLDDEVLQQLATATDGNIYGLVFLFQWNKDASKSASSSSSGRSPLAESDIPEDLFFAHQVTTNACATQAILSVLLNAKGLQQQEEGETDTKSSLGSTLSEFRSFTSSFPPQLKGMAISSSEDIKNAHNSFSRQDAFMHEGAYHRPNDKEDEAFHFIAYVPANGVVYELDGLQQGPIIVGTYDQDEAQTGGASSNSATVPTWLAAAREAIQKRMSDGIDQHIKFNLMAIIQDKRIPLQTRLADSATTDAEKDSIAAQLAAENERHADWKLENQRRVSSDGVCIDPLCVEEIESILCVVPRLTYFYLSNDRDSKRHNYVPLCIQILKELARKDKLRDLITQAKERSEQKRQQKSS